jgi:uncharacterized membrane protein
MGFLAQFHPQIVHGPIALIIVAALFELVGRFVGLDWWRKAAFALLILGVLGAGLAVLSGRVAGEAAEHQGVPEQAVDRHEEMAILTLWLGIGAVVARAVAGRSGPARPVVSGLALALHLATCVTVGVAAHRGGALVFEHGARVRVNGRPVVTPQPKAEAGSEAAEHERH